MSASDPAQWIESAARHQPQRLFLKTPAGRELTYAALYSLSGDFASALMRMGVASGDRVAIQAEKSAEVVLLYVACMRMGAVFVPINTANTPNEVEYFLRDSQPRIAVVRPSDRATLEPAAARAGVHHLETLGADGGGSLLEHVRHTDEYRVMPQGPGKNSPAAIIYTSGTTGRSKGAILSRANLASNAAALAEAWRFTSRDMLLHALPLFHIHGLFAAVNTVLASGSSLLLLPKFDAVQVLKHLPQSTVFMGVPTYYTRLLQLPQLNREAAAGVRLFVSGSAPLLPETHQRFARAHGMHAILERYGMTETLMNTSNPYDGVRKPGSVGPPLPGVEMRVTHGRHRLRRAGAARVGISRSGARMCSAATGRTPKRRASEFTADGWFKTGDLGPHRRRRLCAHRRPRQGPRHQRRLQRVSQGSRDRTGRLAGRAGERRVRPPASGFRRGGDGRGRAAGRGAATAEADVIAALRERLARYKVPRRILFVDELPRNTMGKVQKNLLRDGVRFALRGRRLAARQQRDEATVARTDRGARIVLVDHDIKAFRGRTRSRIHRDG